MGDFDTLVVADLPGLIGGAAEGSGLGHRFLKHVERCRVLLQLIDVSAAADTDPVEAQAVLSDELVRYSAELARRPRLVVATKVEDAAAEARAAALEEALGCPVHRISSVTGSGLAELLADARSLVRMDESEGEPEEPSR